MFGQSKLMRSSPAGCVLAQPQRHQVLLSHSARRHTAARRFKSSIVQASQSGSDSVKTLLEGELLKQVPERLEQVKSRGISLWKGYERSLAAQPVRTKALTSMVGLALGDCIAQASTGCCDPMRTARMAAFGATLHGPMGHLWYQFLDSKVMPEKGTTSAAIVTKMVLDQAVFAPLFTAVFYAVMTTLEGRPDSIMQVLHDKLIPTVFAGYALWPVAHLVSFKFVPSEYRLLYINAVNLVWTVHLSKLASAPMDITTVLSPPVDPSGMPASSAYPSIPVSTGGDLLVTPNFNILPHQA